MKKKPIQISQFTHEGQDIEVLYTRGAISYVFDIAGKRYGNKVRIGGKKKEDIMNACFALIINYLETYAAAKKRQ